MATSESAPLLSPCTEDRAYDSCSVNPTKDEVVLDIMDNLASGTPEDAASSVRSDESSSTTGEEETPQESSGVGKGMGELQAIMTVIKGNMGTGILAMPYAVKSAGLAVGTVTIIIMGIVAIWCMHKLLKARTIMHARAVAAGVKVDMDYPTLVEWTVKTAHPRLAGWPSKIAKKFVQFLLFLSQLGFCSVYIVFAADNVREAVFASTGKDMQRWIYILSVSGAFGGLSQLRGLKKISPVAFVGNIFMLAGLVILFMNFFSSDLPAASERPAIGEWAHMAAAFGMIVYSFEGISLVLPMEKQVENREQYSANYGMLTLSMTIIVAMYTAMGFFGYLVYGDETKASITLNLPNSPWYYFAVKPLYAVVVLLSYNLQFYLPVRLVMKWLIQKYDLAGDERRSVRHRAEAVVRGLLFSITLLIAAAVPDLDLLISFIGAFASSFLALILPALIYFLTMMTEPEGARKITNVFLVFIIIIGALVFVVGTYDSVLKMLP